MVDNSTLQGCDSFNAVDLSHEGTIVPLCELPVPVSNLMEVYVPLETQIPVDVQVNSQNCIKNMVENAADYFKCSKTDMDIEKGNSGTPRTNEETVSNLKNEEGDMFLMNHSLILPKFSTRGEKVVDGPRMRKYKRTTSFNSRKIALMFSVLSSFGTIILIYLTLRVKQMGDASIHS